MLSKAQIAALYRRRAGLYDWSANLYYLLGYREHAYRKRAVAALGLRPGDTVVEIGCGTGLNFALLQQGVGAAGRIIGVDLTDAMLEQAARRVAKRNRSNIELVQSDAAAFEFPTPVDAVISTYALTMVPEYDTVIRNAAQALRPKGRFVVLDLKKPDAAPAWLVRFGAWTAGPFGVSLELADRRPWESIARYFENYTFTELYGGATYIASGEAPRG
ncbi:MAG: methyltransferase domain-containing protein [Pseudomonadota bacterium]|nr:MAG: methyltransferase domain-containing protein [Pseudomonadota bacterium]